MKMKVFTGRWYDTMDAFNNWAKGKALTKEVLIHTHAEFNPIYEDKEVALTIVVIHPEDPHWDKTEPQLTAPIHNVPVPHIKIEEIKVTQ